MVRWFLVALTTTLPLQKAYWTKFKRTVAIKIMSKTNAGETFLQKCLPRELDAIRNLRHENIIHYYEVIETTMRCA